ncbi:MAG: Fe2+-dependent dioxygenase [Caulobacterales bacterium]|nr:Fe2+-dependent dioxygenase [Caulobacterales bacterium]
MFLIIAGVLDAHALDQVRAQAGELEWADGRATAGARAGRVKRNSQARLDRGAGREVHRVLLAAIEEHPVVRAAARPRRVSRLLLSRTEEGGGYGPHVDNALMGSGASRLRADLSFTLFLSEPDAYGGGELVVDLPGAVQSAKPAAGDLVLYPSSSIHEVRPVSAGARLCCVGWIESAVRDPMRRELLFDMENLRVELRAKLPAAAPELLQLDKIAANLLRLWADS